MYFLICHFHQTKTRYIIHVTQCDKFVNLQQNNIYETNLKKNNYTNYYLVTTKL